MNLTDTHKAELTKLSKKSEAVKLLFDWYNEIKEGLWADAYESLSIQIKTFLYEMKERPLLLSNDNQDKGVERADRILLNTPEYLENLDAIAKHLLPEEREESNKRVSHSWDIARKMIDEGAKLETQLNGKE